jgi:hypothetical protein
MLFIFFQQPNSSVGYYNLRQSTEKPLLLLSIHESKKLRTTSLEKHTLESGKQAPAYHNYSANVSKNVLISQDTQMLISRAILNTLEQGL